MKIKIECKEKEKRRAEDLSEDIKQLNEEFDWGLDLSLEVVTE